MVGQRCQATAVDGRSCRATPLHDEPSCFWHSPSHAEEATEARRLGGTRRRRDKTLVGVFDLSSLDTVQGIRRFLEIAMFDTLALEGSIGRSRTLIQGVQAASRLLEASDLEARIAALEAALGPRPPLLSEGAG